MDLLNSIAFITFAGSPGETNPKYASLADARERLKLQALQAGKFQQVLALSWPELKGLASNYAINLPEDPHRYLFTPVLLKLISLGAFGSYDYFLYAGAGCEINNNPIAINDLKWMTKRASKNILHCEHTLHDEILYTKREVLNRIGASKSDIFSPQIMATFFLVSTKTNPSKLKVIADEWLEFCTIEDGELVSDNYEDSLQYQSFIAPRNDQSILSLVLKKHKVKPAMERQRNFSQPLAAMRGSTIFLWTPRNRTGHSCLPKNIESKLLGTFMMLSTPGLRIFHHFRSKYRTLRMRKQRARDYRRFV